MQVIAKHTIILEWQHELTDKFEGLNSESGSARFSISFSETTGLNLYYFNVDIIQICVNRSTHAVFLGKTRTVFDIDSKGFSPSTMFLSALLKEAAAEFEQVYYEEVAQTVLAQHQLPTIPIQEYRDDILGCIDKWDMRS